MSTPIIPGAPLAGKSIVIYNGGANVTTHGVVLDQFADVLAIQWPARGSLVSVFDLLYGEEDTSVNFFDTPEEAAAFVKQTAALLGATDATKDKPKARDVNPEAKREAFMAKAYADVEAINNASVAKPATKAETKRRLARILAEAKAEAPRRNISAAIRPSAKAH